MRNYTLDIKGVFCRELPAPDDVFELKYTEHIHRLVLPTYDVLPQRFNGLETWPLRTNLQCWHCTLIFDTRPIFVPSNPVGDSYAVIGNFCSWNCAAAYIDDNMHRDSKLDARHLLYILCYRFTGKKVQFIVPAPARHVLKIYSGPDGMTPGEYRDNLTKLSYL